MGAYKAIEENKLDSYVIKTAEEGKTIAEYEKFVEKQIKKQQEEYAKKQAEWDKKNGGNKDSWFKSGGFSEGVDGVGDFFGDLGQTAAGTVGDLGLGVIKGVGRLAEGLVDLGTYGVAGVADLFGAEKFAEKTKDVARYSATDEWTKGATDFLDKYSVLGNKADGVAEGIGQVAGIIGTAGIGAAAGLGGAGTAALTTGTMGLSSMGTNIGEAYNSGATDGEAFVYGLGAGAIEAGTELLFGGLGKGVKALGISRGIGGLDDMFAKKLSSKIAGSFANESVQKVLGNTIEFGVKSAGEGFEEVLSGAGSAVMKKLTYMTDEELTKLLKDEDLLNQFIVGTVTSSIMQSPDYIKANKTGTDFVTGQTSEQERVIDAVAEYEVAKREENGEKLTNREKNKIYDDVTSAVSRASVDPLEQAAREVVAERNIDGEMLLEARRRGISTPEEFEAFSRKYKPITADDVKKVTGFGDSGAVLITKLMQEGSSFEQAKGSVETAYRAGLTDVDSRKVKFATDVQKLAFDAGKSDRQVQDRAKQATAQNAAVYTTGFTESEYSAKLTADEREMFSSLSNDLKMDTEMVDKVIAFYVNGKAREANASHKNGKLRVSSTSELPMVSVGIHEVFHRMRQLDPEGTNALMNFLYETADHNARRMNLGDTGVSLFDRIKAEYGNVEGMEAIDYIEEIAAKRSETIFASAEAYNEWRAKLETNPRAKSAWQKFLQIIKEVLEDIWASITNSKMSLEAKRQAQTELELFTDAYRGAIKVADARVQAIESQKNTETSSEVTDLPVANKSKVAKETPTKSAEGLENKMNEDYNSNANYSLKDWRTDLNRTEYKQVEKWIRQAGNPEATRITDTANWYKGRINGEDLFVIYSDKSTILYERKGVESKAELDILLKQLEEIENGRSIVEVSDDINTLLSGDWVQEKHNLANNNAGLGGRGSNTGYATILQRKPSKFIGSQAFRNVVKNILKIQEARLTSSVKEEIKVSHSLKGGIDVSPQRTSEYLDAVEAVQKGKKGAAERLAKYVRTVWGRVTFCYTNIFRQLILLTFCAFMV